MTRWKNVMSRKYKHLNRFGLEASISLQIIPWLYNIIWCFHRIYWFSWPWYIQNCLLVLFSYNGLFCCSIISKLFFSSVTCVFTSKDSRGPAADGPAGMCPNYSRSWSLTSQSHILSIAYLNYNGFCPIISGLEPGDQFHYLARLPGAPSPPTKRHYYPTAPNYCRARAFL